MRRILLCVAALFLYPVPADALSFAAVRSPSVDLVVDLEFNEITKEHVLELRWPAAKKFVPGDFYLNVGVEPLEWLVPPTRRGASAQGVFLVVRVAQPGGTPSPQALQYERIAVVPQRGASGNITVKSQCAATPCSERFAVSFQVDGMEPGARARIALDLQVTRYLRGGDIESASDGRLVLSETEDRRAREACRPASQSEQDSCLARRVSRTSEGSRFLTGLFAMCSVVCCVVPALPVLVALAIFPGLGAAGPGS